MKSLKICITGGSGFVGRALCARLAAAGHRVTVPTRANNAATRLRTLPTVRAVVTDIYDADALATCIRGHDVVVNLVGILNERGRRGDGFKRAHATLTETIIAAMQSEGVPQLVQMSSLKASEDAPSHYLKSKGMAETQIRAAQGLHWTILQPSVIFGPEDGFTHRFANLLKSPILPLARPNTRFAPVYIGDVVTALVAAITEPELKGETLQLCGPQVYSLRELVDLIRTTIGRRGVTIGLPDVIARLQARIMEWIPGKPFSMDNYRSLTQHSICDVNGMNRLGVRPKTLESVAPTYLGLEKSSVRLSRFRKTAGRGHG